MTIEELYHELHQAICEGRGTEQIVVVHEANPEYGSAVERTYQDELIGDGPHVLVLQISKHSRTHELGADFG